MNDLSRTDECSEQSCPKTRNITLQLRYDDQERTYAAKVPYRIQFSDGQVRAGVLDQQGQAQERGCSTASATVEYGYDCDMPTVNQEIATQYEKLGAELDKVTLQLKDALVKNADSLPPVDPEILELRSDLNAGVKEAEAELLKQKIAYENLDWWEQWLRDANAVGEGVVDGVVNYVPDLGEVGKLLGEMDIGITVLVDALVTGDIDDLEQKFNEWKKRASSGFDQLAETMESLILILSDDYSRKLLLSVPERLLEAMPPDLAIKIGASQVTQTGIDMGVTVGTGIVTAVTGPGAVVATGAVIAGTLLRKGGKLLEAVVDIIMNLIKTLKKRKNRTDSNVKEGKDDVDKKDEVNLEGTGAQKPGNGYTETNQSPTNGNGEKINQNEPDGGEPISLVTGEEVLKLVDFQITGLISMDFERVYRSGCTKNVGLGHGWMHSFSDYIHIKDDTIIYHDPQGRLIHFVTPDLGAVAINRCEQLVLKRVDQDHYQLTHSDPDQPLARHFKRSTSDYSHYTLSEISDPFNHRIRCHYQQLRLVELSTDTMSWYISYNLQGLMGQITQNNAQGKLRHCARYHYSQDLDLIQATDAKGHSEHYRYQHHLLTQRTLKSGYNFYFQWDSTEPTARCIKNWGDSINGQNTYCYRFNWNKAQRSVEIIDTRQGREYYQFNEQGLPIRIIDAMGGEQHFKYNRAGQLTQIRDALGHCQHYFYRSDGHLQSYIDQNGAKTSYFRHTDGRLKKRTNALGESWKFHYNKNHQLIESIDPLGHSTQYRYNALGLVNTVVDANDRQWHYIWDPQGLLVAKSDPTGQHTRYQYDDWGQLIKIIYPDGTSCQYHYDEKAQCTQVNTPDGLCQQFSYNALGLISQTKDQQGRTIQYHYDGLSQVVKRIDAMGQALHYHYDGERNLIGLTNEQGERYHLEYDLNERLIAEIGFDGRKRRYYYNANGNLIQSDECNEAFKVQHRLYYQRNKKGQLTQHYNQDHSINNAYQYDALDRLITAHNPHRQLTYRYDACGRLIEDLQDAHRLYHQYDAVGQRTSTILPNGKTIQYHYDLMGQLSEFHYNSHALSVMEYDSMGRETQRLHGNEIITAQDYDPQGRLAQQTIKKTQSPQRHFKQHFKQQRHYHYDAQGRINRIEDQLRGDCHYHYDLNDRLTRVTGVDPEQFIFDPASTLMDKDASSDNTRGRRLSFYGDAHYSYDQRGNRTDKKYGKNQCLHSQYHYNDLNQLIALKQGQEITHYQYDPLGRRIRKINRVRTEFLWCEDVLLCESQYSLEPVQPYTQPVALTARWYLFEPESFRPLAFDEGGQLYYYHLDHLGTPREITDSQGQLVWAVAYQAYGNVVRAYQQSITNPLRFQGQYYDQESGLHYNRFRYYDPDCGAYISQDPIGLLGGVNSYQYVPNPISWVDPFGLTSKDCDPKVTKGAKPGSYRPDRALPRDKHGNPIPDTNAPHTQLGTKKGRNGDYTQAREFDANGKPVRDIDFTDHGRPQNHPNPHQHRYVPNETGGTLRRLKDAEPL